MANLGIEIEQLLSFLKQEEKKYVALIEAAPPGSLRAEKRGKNYNFIHALKEEELFVCIKAAKAGNKLCEDVLDYNGSQNVSRPVSGYFRIGITKRPDIVIALARKEYAKRTLERIRYNTRVLRSAKERIKDISPEVIQATMKKVFKTLQEAGYLNELYYLMNDDKSLSQLMKKYEIWATSSFRQSDFKSEQKLLRTSQGVNVRTKAELIIAERLHHFEVPFRYEQALMFGKVELAPDFTFPEGRDDEFYWEYCGMMDNQDYVNRFLWKRGIYEANGINEWNGKIIYTYSRNNEMDITEIDHIIKEKIIPRM